MANEERPPWIDFGAVIAFLAPGFIVFGTYLRHLPQNERWIDVAAPKDQGLGSFSLVVLASLAVGLVVSGLRDLIIDWPLRQFRKKKRVKPIAVDWSKITKDNLKYLLLARDNYFRFYQFYANSAVGLAISAIANAVWSMPSWRLGLLTMEVLVIVALVIAAARELTRYLDAVSELGLGRS